MSVRWQSGHVELSYGHRIAHALAWALCVAVCLYAAPLRGNDLPTIREVIEVWQKRSHAVQLAWRHDINDVYVFHRYQADWLPVNDGDSEPERMLIDKRRLRFETVRWTVGEHGYDKSQFGSAQVIADFPERSKQDPYLTALRSRFADPGAEFRESRPFVRVFDETVVQDYWPPLADQYPRGVIRTCLPVGAPMRSAAVPTSISDELQDLSVVAAILALHPLHPGLALAPESYQVAAEPVFADGKPCAVLLKSGQNATDCRTTIWVDLAQNFAIRRLIADDGRRGCQIDIEYRRDEPLGWAPSAWTVCSFGQEHGARLDAVNCLVTRVSPRDALTKDESTVRFASHTWVIDEIEQEQYILREDGTKREVRTEEFHWLPTHSELSATEPGNVGALVERKARWTQYWRSARIPLVLGVTAIASGMALARWRRHHKQS